MAQPGAPGAWGGARSATAATLSDRVVRYDIDASLDPAKHTDWRMQVDGSSMGGWLAAFFVLTQPVVAMLAWGRIARLYGLAEPAAGAKVVQPAQVEAMARAEAAAAPSNAAPALA